MKRSLSRWQWLVVVLAFVVRLGYAMSQGIARPVEPGTDESEYDAYGWNVAQGNGYRGMSPDVTDQNHLTAYRPPGPSLVYAAMYAVGGHRPAVVRVFNCIISALACAMIMLIGRRTVGDTAGFLAAIAWAGWPVSIFLSGTLFSEQLATIALLGLIWYALEFARAPAARVAIVFGVVLGINLMTHGARLFMVPLLLLWAAVQFRGQWRVLRLTLLAPIATAVVITPWIVRNYNVFHRFVPMSTMGGSMLLQGNNRIVDTDPAYRGYNIWDAAIPEYRDALKAPDNEIGRDSVAKQLASEWIAAHRDRMVPMAIAKIQRGWTPFLQPQTSRMLRLTMLASWGPVLVLGLIGFVVLLPRWLRERDPSWLLHCTILHIVLINAIFFGYARYRYPVEPYCLMLAAWTVVWAARRIARDDARIHS